MFQSLPTMELENGSNKPVHIHQSGKSTVNP
jgi:hypothetical protein